MIKKLPLIVLLLIAAVVSYGQKSKSKSLTLEYTIDPIYELPADPVTYRSVLTTPINPLTHLDELTLLHGVDDREEQEKLLKEAREKRLNELRNEYLQISGAQYIASENGDLTVSLETSDVEVTYVNDKPIGQLSQEEDVFRYNYSATLTVKDKTDKVLFEKLLVRPDEEQKMTKAVLFFNPAFKAKFQLYKNNPEKLKEFSDQMLERKNQLVLLQVLEMADKALADAYEVQSKSFIVGVFTVKGKNFDELNTVSDNIFDAYMKFRAFNKKKRLSEEDMDQVLRDATVVWNKYLEQKREMEEQASKGLLLNCALAYTWLGDLDKAATYLDQVEEANVNALNEDELEDEEPDGPGTLGATVILSFPSYAFNMRKLYEAKKEYQPRMKIRQ